MSAATVSRLGWLALVPASLCAGAGALFAAGRLPLLITLPWVPAAGAELTLHVDALALLFVLLITGIGTFVFVYAAGYSADDPGRRRLFALLLVFMVAMIGCVTADNLLALFAFWELTSVVSFLLVGHHFDTESARKSAQQALLVTGGGGLALLAGLVLLAETGGSYSLVALLQSAPGWIDDPRVTPALACIFIGTFTKSAQFPFMFWLPNAMSAPTPASAYLHSATMVKLGVYLLCRLHPAFGSLLLWQEVLIVVGGFTSVVGMLLTLRERDLKRILAWSTASALGTITLLIGIPGDGAATATAALLLAHAMYKAPLFFVAGNIDHATGTRRIDDLSALAPLMPFTAVAALLAAVSMAGMPLSFGFIAKDLVSLAKAEGSVYPWVGYSSLVVSAISVAVAGVAAIRVFWHRGGLAPGPDVREGSVALWLPPLLLAGLGVVLGPLPHLLDPLIGAAAEAMRPRLEYAGLRFSLEDGAALGAVSAAALAGVVVFLNWDRLHRLLERVSWLDRFSPLSGYQALLRGIPATAAVSTRLFQHGGLSGYTAILIGAVVSAVGLAWTVARPPLPAPGAWPDLAVIGASALLVMVAISVCVVRDSFLLLLVSGFAGLGSAIVFLFLGAPDLAFTQFAVEVAFVAVTAAILLRLRRAGPTGPAPRPSALRALLALGSGAAVAAVLLAAVEGPANRLLSGFFSAQSVPQAQGRNVVNVIIVDFRALDTLGEIAVVGASLLAALPLLRLAAGLARRDGGRR